MDPLIRILHLEDAPADAELVQVKLEDSGLACRITLVQTRDEFGEALRQDEYDIILADYQLPMYDGMSALQLIQELHPDVPFIFVSGTMGEDAAIEALTEGATDYVLKGNLSRLGSAVRRALFEAENRRERKQAEAALRASEERYRMVYENSPVEIWEEDFSTVKTLFDDLKKQGVTDIEAYFDRHPETVLHYVESTKVVDVNRAALALNGATNKEELLTGLVKTFTPESFDTFRRGLVILWNGETEMNGDSVVKTLAGDRRNVTVYFSVCPGHEETLSKVLVSIIDITDRKMAEQKLEEQKVFLQKSLDSLTHPFYVININDYTIALANTASQLQEFQQGITCYQLAYNRSEPCAGPECPCPIQEVLKKQNPAVLEHLHHDENGNKKYIEVHAYPIFSEGGEIAQIIEYCIDISERRKHERERLRLTAVIEQTADSIVITDSKAIIQYVNPGFEKTTGYSAAEAIGKNPRILQSGRYNAQFYQEMWSTVTKGKVWRGHIINKKKDGSLYNEEASITPVLDDDGKVINYVALKRDVTKQKELEVHLQQAQKMEAIGSLAGGIAHDFNNLLSAIFGYTELAMDELDDAESLRKDLDEVLKGAGRAKDLVKQILAFSRRGEQKLQPIKIQFAIKEALKLLRSSIPTTIEINTSINPDCETILADSTQIHQVIMNLCTNAYHAMRKTGGRLAVSLKPIQLTTDFMETKIQLPPGAYVKLEISDTGTGIPKDVQDRIFEPYYTTKAKGEGTGLGLAVVHGIITRLHGDITVYSVVNKGTTFSIWLPVAASSAENIQKETPTLLPTGNERILLVDDDIVIAQMNTKLLERLGYKVTALTSSLDTLNKFQQEPNNFDLIITDMTMPNMTGIELARQILTIRPDMKIILCTGFSDLVNEEKAKNIGIRDYIMKPVIMNDLANSVRKVLDAS